jgi:hypothetical protein
LIRLFNRAAPGPRVLIGGRFSSVLRQIGMFEIFLGENGERLVPFFFVGGLLRIWFSWGLFQGLSPVLSVSNGGRDLAFRVGA